MFGIQCLYRNKLSGWITSNGNRLEFPTQEEAHQELSRWRKQGWWPSTIRYVVKAIEEQL